MITNSEINAVDLSPTKKDFYQIWNELMEVAGKLSERWDPTSTNESDPGIVLLKVLTAVADKLNYTIDINTLEAFMPSAAQEESMRKLTEMMGYNMKYFRSATTDVKISYNLNGKTTLTIPLLINKYTNIKDIDSNINYITLEDTYLNAGSTSKIVPCIEGELVECETDDNNIISIFHLDDNKRYFLPETQIAENGIFITNIINGVEEDLWEKVDNLNTQNIGAHVFKFGYDSKEDLPYIQFPDDISTIIEDGLKIKYLRTNGINGNISPKTLCKMETPSSWSLYEDTEADYLNVDNYNISNPSAAINGRNREGLTDAYNNYKKTIGTFDTLVTCRDYINKIYQMTASENSSTPLVSNVIVSDIRDDINKAMTMCTFTERGIEYKTMAKPVDLNDAIEKSQSEYNSYISNQTHLEESLDLGQLLKVVSDIDSTQVLFYARCLYNGTNKELVQLDTRELTHFDLLIYPFRAVYGLNNKQEFIKSFKYDNSNILEIQDNLESNKTLSHNFIDPNKDEIACIKNYYKLTAKITTTKKVNTIEQADILGKVYSKLYENFNMRKVDFGEEIPYDTILSVLETADNRIKTVSLEDPVIATKYCTVGGGEYEVMDITNTMDDSAKAMALIGNKYYNKTVLNNVLAGRVELFNYDENFKPDYTENKYPSWLETKEDGTETEIKSYDLIYPTIADTTISVNNIVGPNGVSIDPNGIHRLVSSFEITEGAKNIKLRENEVVQFRLPNLKTVKTYPAYVNYFIKLDPSNIYSVPAIPATMQTLLRFIENGATTDEGKKTAWESVIEMTNFPKSLLVPVVSGTDFEVTDGKFSSKEDLRKAKAAYHALFTKDEANNDQYNYVTDTYITDEPFSDSTIYYYPRFNNNSSADFTLWRNWIMSITEYSLDVESTTQETKNIKFKGLYKNSGVDFSKSCGNLVDNLHNKYKLVEVYANIISDPFENYYLPRIWNETISNSNDSSAAAAHTENGLGQNAEYGGIAANKEYCLKPSEYLLINYTSSSSTEGAENKTKINTYYGPGTIIKPNFELIDSEEYNKLHKYPKQDGFSFTDYGSIENPAGMFTLGTNEQIEIREFVSVKLDEMSTNIYWQRKDETPDMYNRIKFTFDEDPIDNEGQATTKDNPNFKKCLSYTLKDGEYFYYTGPNKTDIAWYGSGTKIKRTDKTPEIYKYGSDDSISTEDIASQGLSAAIPWRPFDFSKNGGFDRSLSLIEYQYINLINGNTLCTITSTESSDTDPEATCIKIDLTDTYTPIKGAKYALSGDVTTTNSDTIITSLPTVDFNNNVYWEVRSRLEFNVGPTLVQTLYNRSSEDGTGAAYSKIELYGYNTVDRKPDRLIATLQPQLNSPLSIKTNKLYQTSVSDISVTAKEYSEDGSLQRETADLQLKVFSSVAATKSNGEFINLNNFGGTFTKLLFEEPIIGQQNATTAAVRLNLLVPENRFGLFMIYNNKISASADSTKIRFISATPLKADGNESVVTPKIFNYQNTNYAVSSDNYYWWGGESNNSLNYNGYGCIKNDAKLWAVEGCTFDTLSEADFNALAATGVAIYKRTAIVNNPDITAEILPEGNGKIQRLDYETPLTLYEYEKVSEYENGHYYGTLLDEGGTGQTVYQLRKGINIIKVDGACSLEIYSSLRDALGGNSDVLILSSLDIIYNEPYSEEVTYQTPINEKLVYKGTSLNSAQTDYISGYEQILKDIKAIDPNYLFYYNVPVQNALGIDMNKDDEYDNLMNSSNWYDLNNINNKFVISEIDANYLPTGVTIARTSRSN